MKYGLTIPISLCLLNGVLAQTSQLTRLDTAALNFIFTGPGVPAGNGGTVVMIRETNSFSLEKLSASGEAEWRHRYPPTMANATWDIAPTTNGDVLLAYSGTLDVQGDFFDTVYVSWELWRINPAGEVLWRKVAQEPAIVAYIPAPFSSIRVVESNQGELFLVNTTHITTANLVSLTKFSGEGAPLWSRRIGDTSDGDLVPFPSDIPSRTQASPDPTGGCRLVVPAADYFDESGVIVSITADGSLAWGRLYDYLGLVNDFSMAAAAVSQNGNTLFQTYSTSENGELHLVRISPSGELLSVEQYGNGLFCENLVNDQGILRMVGAGRVITLNENGDLLEGVGLLPIPASSDSTYSLQIPDMSVMTGRVCLSGSLIATPADAGLPWASLATGTFNIDGSGCGLVHYPMNAPHVALPNSIFTCEPIPSLASETLVVPISDGPQLSEPRTLLEASEVCGLFVGIDEIAAKPSLFEIYPNPCGVGSSVNIRCDGAKRFKLYSTTGSEISDFSSSVGLSTPLSCTGLPTGLHVIVAFDKDGRRLATAKLEVE